MRTARPLERSDSLARLALAALVASGASALAPGAVRAESPRAAHAIGLFVDAPAVLVARDRAIVASLPDGAVSVCAYATGACRPIRSARACDSTRCSSGVIVELDGAVADVGDFPSDREGIAREQALVASDERVSSMAGSLPQPPPPTPPPSFGLREEDWRFEASLGAGVALRPEPGIALPSIGASFGWGIGIDWDGEEILQALFGNLLGVDLRVRVLPSILGASLEQASVQVGLAPRAHWAPRGEPFRMGGFYFSLLPELGVITRPDRDPAFYVGWSYPITLALDPHVGAELRAWAYAVDDWVEGDDVGWLLGVDASLVVF